MPDVPVKSLKKALDLMDLLLFEAGPEGLPLTRLAARLGLPPNTAHNLLKTMTVCGYAEQAPDGARYRAGGKWQQAGRLRLLQEREVLARRLQALAETLNETCVLATLANGDRVAVARAEGRQVVRVAPSAFEGSRIYDSPTGRILVAFADAAERRAVLERHGFPGPRWDGIRTDAALEKAIAAIRKTGSCWREDDELFACAAPILDPSGALIGAIGCYAPKFRCPPEGRDRITAQIRAAAAAMAGT